MSQQPLSIEGGMLLVKNELEEVRGREEERKRRSLHPSRAGDTASPRWFLQRPGNGNPYHVSIGVAAR